MCRRGLGGERKKGGLGGVERGRGFVGLDFRGWDV